MSIDSRQRDSLPTIKTKRLLLRPLLVEDVSDNYVNWLNDPKVVAFLDVGFESQTRAMVLDYIRFKLADTKSSKHLGIFDEAGSRHVGTATFNAIKWRHLTAELSYVIGLPAAWGKGYATEAVHAMVTYGFESLGLRKIMAGYWDGHDASAKVLAKNGFRPEGCLRKACQNHEGERVDHILVGLLREDFRPDPVYWSDSEQTGS